MRIALAAVMLLMLFAVGGMAMGPVFEDFESKDAGVRWEFSNGKEFPGAAGAFRVTKAAAKEGNLGGELRFDFRGGGNYVEASCAVAAGRPVRQVWLWVRKNTANRMTLRCSDSEGQTFQRGFNFAYRGWQELHIALDGWDVHWGGKNDGVFRGAPTRIGFIVENDGARTGSVHLDNIRLVEDQPRASSAQTEYTVLTFGPDESWGLTANGKSGASRWTAPLLKYDYSGGATSVGVVSDVAIMGKPSKLILTLESEQGGADVRLQLAGHFQSFEKTLGTLSGTGRQEFVVDLVGMPGWSHHGGDDNGVPVLPLRVIGLCLDRSGESRGGEARLLEIKAVTAIPPEMSVVLVPSGQADGKRAAFSCALRNLTGEDVSGELTWSVRDWSGREIAAGSRMLAAKAGASAQHSLRAPVEGSFSECVFRYRSGSRTYGPVSTTAVLPVKGKGSSVLVPESPFGMGLYLYRAADNEDGRADVEAKAALAASAGVKWSREEFQWHRVEPEKGRFDFGFYDHLVETANRNGISVYGLIAYWSRWTKPYTQEGIEDYARYCTALVTHFKDRIKHWEIWNEPNIFFWSGPKELYPELLKAAYRAIKEADPEARVLGCSTAGIDTPFIKSVTEAGAPFDILTIHPYRGSLDEMGFIKELRDTVALTKSADGKEKPVWITEMGLPTQLYGGLSERNQATFLARCYLSGLASGVDTNISWYDFREDGGNPFYNEHRFGVVRHPDMAPKPGFRALATVCRTLADARVEKQLDLGKSVLGFSFKGAARQTVAVWSSAGDQLLSLNISGRDVTITDLMGDAVSPAEFDGQSLLALRASSPVFISGRGLEVEICGAPITLEAPHAAHSGDAVRMTAKGLPPGSQVALTAPDGWEVVRKPRGVFEIAVPKDAVQGAHECVLTVRSGLSRVMLPVSIAVTPEVLEV